MTSAENHSVFMEALQKMLQATQGDPGSGEIAFPSALEPEELDRPMLARFLNLLR